MWILVCRQEFGMCRGDWGVQRGFGCGFGCAGGLGVDLGGDLGVQGGI